MRPFGMAIRRGVVVAVTAACMVLLSAASAFGAFTVTSLGGSLTVTGDLAADVVTVGIAPADPNSVIVDIGSNGSADYTFPRATVPQITINGGDGADQLTLAMDEVRTNEQFQINGDQASDVINNGPAGALLYGGFGDDTINGGAGADAIIAGDGVDTVDGGSGDDQIFWNPGDDSDSIAGGPGVDQLDFLGSNAGEIVNIQPNGLGGVQLTRDVGAVNLNLFGIQRFKLQALGGNDTVTGAAGLRELIVLNIDAGAGNDTVTGGDGADRVDGGIDPDTLNGGDGSDLLAGSAGADIINGGAGDDGIDGGTESDVVDGQAGIDGCVNSETMASCERNFLPPEPPNVPPVPEFPDVAPAPQLPIAILQPNPAVGTVKGTKRGLTVAVSNPASVVAAIQLAVSEKFAGRKYTYALTSRNIAAGATATVTLRAPAALKKAIAKALKSKKKITRKPVILLRNVSGTQTQKPTVTTRR